MLKKQELWGSDAQTCYSGEASVLQGVVRLWSKLGAFKMSDWVFNCWGTKKHAAGLIVFLALDQLCLDGKTIPVGPGLAPGEGNRRARSQGSSGHGLSEPVSLLLFKEQTEVCAWLDHWYLKETSPWSLIWLAVTLPSFAYTASSSPRFIAPPATHLVSSVVFPATSLSPSQPQ